MKWWSRGAFMCAVYHLAAQRITCPQVGLIHEQTARMIRPKDEDAAVRDELDELIDRACEADPLPPYAEELERPRGPPLSRDERRDAQLRLAMFQPPPDFIAVTKALCDRCNSEDWFNRPYLKFLHDAYVLAEFVRLTPVEGVRLAKASEQWPDGCVRIAGKTHNIEITSTHGGRPLGKEYRGERTIKMDPVENWVARAESIPRYLRESIEAKSKKNYASPCWLIVYLNINELGIRQAETEKVIEAVKAEFAASFESISVLWKEKLY